MKKWAYLLYIAGFLAIIEFIYSLVKLNSIDWKSLAVAIGMISSLILLKIKVKNDLRFP